MVQSVATEKKSPVTPSGIDPETVRLVTQCLNHYATPDPDLQVKYSSFLSDFNVTYIFSTGFQKILEYQIS